MHPVCPSLTLSPSSLASWPSVESSSAACQPQLHDCQCPASTDFLQEGPATTSFFNLYDVHGVLEWHTIPGQWAWPTAVGALVPAGHTKVVQKSTGLLKPLVKSMVAPDLQENKIPCYCLLVISPIC